MATKTGIKKPGSGRTKGAVSIVTVSLQDLMNVFANPSQRIAVSRKFIEPFGIPYQNLEGQSPLSPAKNGSPTITPAKKKAPVIKTRDFSRS